MKLVPSSPWAVTLSWQHTPSNQVRLTQFLVYDKSYWQVCVQAGLEVPMCSGYHLCYLVNKHADKASFDWLYAYYQLCCIQCTKAIAASAVIGLSNAVPIPMSRKLHLESNFYSYKLPSDRSNLLYSYHTTLVPVLTKVAALACSDLPSINQQLSYRKETVRLLHTIEIRVLR